MAEAMGRMGYAASAFGNHELDFGREAFVSNRARGGYPYLAANLRVRGAGLEAMELPSFAVFERRGVRVGVIGLATEETLRTAMASRFEGIEFTDEEQALERAVPAAWRAGPDALVLIAHECPDKITPILARHPEWDLSFVGTGHCHKRSEALVGGVPVVNPSWRMRSYARVRLEIDPRRPPRRRVTSAAAEVVDVARPEGAPAVNADDAPIAAAAAAWQARLDQALGEPIGYSDGMEKDSEEIGRWIGEAWRDQLKVDVAILNKGGIRQAMPRGEITKATVYSILPFDNKLLICSLTGGQIVELIGNAEAVYAGLSRNGNRYVLPDGKPFEVGRLYTVATIDFLYFGGDGFTFQAQDPRPSWTGLDWRAPVISWTKARRTSPSSPLERLVK
ncbi:MAG: bifunctional metallophosphatase/5'-nucleotidase [Polyangiaceae bacterium]|nr:bifunctional metallophosphatase/5'-nucleotidase [Polyangiaceae bacterium]